MQQKELLIRLLQTFLPRNFVGVEIGVDHATTTVQLLENCGKFGHIYAVDPYIRREGRAKEVTKILSKYDHCTFLRMKSDEAADHVPDGLDFVFIDGDHSYGVVKSDLNNYVSKIRSRGILVGHDWTTVRKDFGVVQACNEYLTEHEELFYPLFSNQELKEMGLPEFKRGGWSEEANRHLIHKKRPSAFPLWWLVKR